MNTKILHLSLALLLSLAWTPTVAADECTPRADVFGYGVQRCSGGGDTWDGSSGSDYEAWDYGENVVYGPNGNLVAVGEYNYWCRNPGGTESCHDGDDWTDVHVTVLGSTVSVSDGQRGGRPGWQVCFYGSNSILAAEAAEDCPILLNP